MFEELIERRAEVIKRAEESKRRRTDLSGQVGRLERRTERAVKKSSCAGERV